MKRQLHQFLSGSYKFNTFWSYIRCHPPCMEVSLWAISVREISVGHTNDDRDDGKNLERLIKMGIGGQGRIYIDVKIISDLQEAKKKRNQWQIRKCRSGKPRTQDEFIKMESR